MNRRRISHPQQWGLVAPTLLIARDDLDTMMAYMAHSPDDNEINGFAYVRQLSARTFEVVEGSVFITEQFVAPSEATVTPVGYVAAETKADMDDMSELLRLQWHSHVWSQAVHSSTDLNTANNFGDAGDFDWMIWLVGNRYGDIMGRLEQYAPIRMGLPITIEVTSPVDDRLIEQIQDDIDNHVTVRPSKPRRWPYPDDEAIEEDAKHPVTLT